MNEIGEKVIETCKNVKVGMQIFMDDINTTTKQSANVKMSIRNCRRMEIEYVWFKEDKIYGHRPEITQRKHK